jgi:flavodoxin
VVFVSALFFILTTIFSNNGYLIDTSTFKKNGFVKIFEPKEIKLKTEKTDYLVKKDIKWYDFFANIYEIKYNTRYLSFLETKQNHKTVEYDFRYNTPNSMEYYNKLYKNLAEFDKQKIDSITILFAKESKEKKLSQLQTAEMVTTFIQEIPYVLVHQNTCKQLMELEPGDSYLVKYHLEKKPCLASVPGGVQSPYEFLHNLKGDCDTRSLLGYAILTKLNISSSICVSKVYGHCVLGIGLPVGNGVYKSIDGLKHYAVELTNKGFRLGMISPEQRDISNWDIALYSNNF